MEIILTHEQADFDAAGSVLAAWLLDPSRVPILPKRRNRNLAAFIEDYKTRLPFFTWENVPKGTINRVYVTDTQKIAAHARLTGVKDVIVWDHHPQRQVFPDREENIYDPTGACTTFLVEKLQEKPELHPGRIFLTLMLMGIYEDTGSLSYGSTTPRDIRAAAWLVEKGADLDLMRRYILQPMTEHQQLAFDVLMQNGETYDICGERILIAAADVREISDEFSAVAHHMRDMLSPDGLVLVLAAKTGVRLISRGTTDRIDFGQMMKTEFNGGGHRRAASGTVPFADPEMLDASEILEDIQENILTVLPKYIEPPKLNLAEALDRSLSGDQLELIGKVAEMAESLDMPVYIVGGVVRDLLLDRPVKDFDIVVEGDATSLGRKLSDQYGGKLTVHSQFFTAKWMLPDGNSLDLISARSDSYAAPAALPTVAKDSMEADLHRRDFTLNTLAIRLDGETRGELLDCCNGLRDLRGEWIRTLHDRSFIDDPTRLFRAVRFEQRFDFTIEPDTLRQLREQLSGVALLTGQRIWHELRLYCEEPVPEDDFVRIVQLGIARQIHDGLEWSDAIRDDCVRFRASMLMPFWLYADDVDFELVDSEGLLWIWLSCFPEVTITELGERLLLAKKTLNGILGVARLRNSLKDLVGKSPSVVTFFLEKIPVDALYCYERFCDSAEEKALIEKFISVWRTISAFSNGEDLMKKGIQAGPELRETLLRLRAARLDGLICTKEDEDRWLDHAGQKDL